MRFLSQRPGVCWRLSGWGTFPFPAGRKDPCAGVGCESWCQERWHHTSYVFDWNWSLMLRKKDCVGEKKAVVQGLWIFPSESKQIHCWTSYVCRIDDHGEPDPFGEHGDSGAWERFTQTGAQYFLGVISYNEEDSWFWVVRNQWKVRGMGGMSLVMVDWNLRSLIDEISTGTVTIPWVAGCTGPVPSGMDHWGSLGKLHLTLRSGPLERPERFVADTARQSQTIRFQCHTW